MPVALSGRDIIGIAKTGSGKTAAFVWPMLVHCIAQSELKSGDGPIAMICAPTRERCQQINSEVKRFGKCYNLQVSFVLVLSVIHRQKPSLEFTSFCLYLVLQIR